MNIAEFLITNELGQAFYNAHQDCARRSNISSMAVLNASMGNGGDAMKCIASALLTLGDAHAPLVQCYNMYKDIVNTPAHMQTMLEDGLKIPGLGTSFVRGKPDPAWDRTDSLLTRGEFNNDVADAHFILNIAKGLIREKKGADLYPNAAFYTTVVAYHIGLTEQEMVQLFIIPRLPVWCDIMKGQIPWLTDKHC